jgi:hypothetical protein
VHADAGSRIASLDLYTYWLSKRGARVMPARTDIDPADIPQLLPYLTIAEKAGDQFRYRLKGTGVVWGGGLLAALLVPALATRKSQLTRKHFGNGFSMPVQSSRRPNSIPSQAKASSCRHSYCRYPPAG